MAIKSFYSFSLSESGLYKIPFEPTKEESLRYISSLPLTPLPEVFGLHENADISKNNQETDLVMKDIIALLQLVLNL